MNEDVQGHLIHDKKVIPIGQDVHHRRTSLKEGNDRGLHSFVCLSMAVSLVSFGMETTRKYK